VQSHSGKLPAALALGEQQLIRQAARAPFIQAWLGDVKTDDLERQA
jgi:hypothetical protein